MHWSFPPPWEKWARPAHTSQSSPVKRYAILTIMIGISNHGRVKDPDLESYPAGRTVITMPNSRARVSKSIHSTTWVRLGLCNQSTNLPINPVHQPTDARSENGLPLVRAHTSGAKVGNTPPSSLWNCIISLLDITRGPTHLSHQKYSWGKGGGMYPCSWKL